MASPLNGFFEATIKGKPGVVEYEPDTELRDTEQIPPAPLRWDRRLPGKGGPALRARRLVATRTGEEQVGISFTQHFYKAKPMRPLDEIRANILKLERETEGLLDWIIRSYN